MMFVTRKRFNAVVTACAALRKELEELQRQMKPVQEFMKEHAENIKEAEEEYLKQQKLTSEGMQRIFEYNPFTKKEG
jgi:predicted  nucleic acid-binding Zn-ribbon protein